MLDLLGTLDLKGRRGPDFGGADGLLPLLPGVLPARLARPTGSVDHRRAEPLPQRRARAGDPAILPHRLAVGPQQPRHADRRRRHRVVRQLPLAVQPQRPQAHQRPGRLQLGVVPPVAPQLAPAEGLLEVAVEQLHTPAEPIQLNDPPARQRRLVEHRGEPGHRVPGALRHHQPEDQRRPASGRRLVGPEVDQPVALAGVAQGRACSWAGRRRPARRARGRSPGP